MRAALESEERRLDRRLVDLRRAIESKRQNVEDLNQVLQDDFQRLNKIPRYIWFLMAIHGFMACHMYQSSLIHIWIFNVICFLWFHRRLYRKIHGWVPLLSIATLVWSFLAIGQQ